MWAGLYGGLRLFIDSSCEITLLLGLYEAETTPFLRRAGGVMRSMVDVGAGYGEMAAWALKHPNVEKVLAFDPKLERWPIFQENMSLNGFRDDPRLLIYQDFFPGSESVVVSLLALPEPVLIKIDIDGAELKVLHEIHDFLSQKRIFLLLETHSKSLDTECRRFLECLGFVVNSVPKAWWRRFAPERRPIGFNQWLWAKH